MLLLLLCLLILPDAVAYAHHPGPVVCIINSYHSELKWVSDSNRAIMEELGPTVKYHVFDMDTKRIPESDFKQRAAEAIQFIDANRPDLVFLGDDIALKLLASPLTDRKIPTIYYAINNNPRYYLTPHSNRYITGVLERPMLRRSLEYLRAILPNARKVTILFDDSLTSRVVMAETFNGQTEFKQNGLLVTLKLIDNWEVWQDTVLGLKADGTDIVTMSMMHRIRSSDDAFVGYEAVAEWTSAHTPVPLFGFWEVAVGPRKAIGGLVLDGYMQGVTAARLGQRVLHGEHPNTIPPVTAEQGKFIFSRAQLQRWNIHLPDQMARQAVFVE